MLSSVFLQSQSGDHRKAQMTMEKGLQPQTFPIHHNIINSLTQVMVVLLSY